MMKQHLRKHLLSLCLICLLFTGCKTMTSESVPCPKAVILAEFSKTVDLAHSQPIRSEIDSIYPACTKEEGSILVDFKLRITSIRSLAQYHDPLKLRPSYFVAVIDTAGNVISRSNHEFDVNFEEKQTTKVSYQYLQEKVPVGKEVILYVGFNLDRAEVEFLRSEREGKILP